VIGGKHQTKMLPQEKIINICRQINMPVILLGGNEDHASGVKIQQSLGDIAFNACGFYNIKQSASILFQAEKIISNDTGLMHIAAAFNKPIISVWGNTIPEFGMYPYMPLHPERSHIVEVMGLSCRPCSKIGFNKCPRKHFRCMEDISEEEIVEKLNH
jgi:ADP-heptose:LPS heptosyltransferase